MRAAGCAGVAALALLLAGCAHTVEIDSDPPGAAVRIDGRLQGYTPLTVKVPWRPAFTKDYDVVVRLTDHRTVRGSLRSEMRLWRPVWRAIWHPFETLRGCPEPGDEAAGPGTCPDHVLNFALIDEHGAAGTWSPEDVP